MVVGERVMKKTDGLTKGSHRSSIKSTAKGCHTQ